MMVVHHMLTTSNLTIYLAFPEQEAAHRVVDHTWSNEVACRNEQVVDVPVVCPMRSVAG